MDYGSKYRGIVRGLSEDYEDKDLVRLEIEHSGPKPKPKKGMPTTSGMMTRSYTISKEMAQHLAIGDRVEIETMVRKIRRVSRKGGDNPGHKEKGGY